MNTAATTTTTTTTTATATATAAATMQAVANEQYGRPDQLRVGSVDRPTPGPGQVLVAVEAAGVDRGVWHVVTGLPYAVRLAGFGLTRPKQPIPGMDLAGRVVALGDGVTRYEVGDEVVGIGSGTFAAYAVADEAKLALRPPSIPAELAAVTPVSGLTALQAVRDVAGVEAGQRVLILGASGGVGSFAVQIAKHLGAHVTGVASAAKLDLVRDLGADRVLDYRVDDVLAETYDVIIDTGGRRPVRHLRRALTRRGTLVIVGGEGGGRFTGGAGRQLRALALSPFVPQRLTTFMSSAEGLGDLVDLLADGVLRPAIDRTYPLAEAPQAIDDLVAGRVSGKAAIRVAD